jgi:ureidoglycolate hydrolase
MKSKPAFGVLFTHNVGHELMIPLEEALAFWTPPP